MTRKHPLEAQFLSLLFIVVILFTLQPHAALGQAPGAYTTTPLFLPPVSYDSGGFGALSVAVADVNGDGKPDLLVTNECAASGGCNHGSVGVLLGNGDGTFQPALTYDSGGYLATSIAVADVSGDGKSDLIVTSCASNTTTICPTPSRNGVVGVLLGNGDGTFQPAVSYDSGGAGAWSVAVNDLNGDAKDDLAVADYSSSCTVGVLLGKGDGTFQAVTVYGSGWSGAVSVAASDVNGDGAPDLLLSCQGGEIAVLLGNGDGTFRAAASYDSGSGNLWSVSVADVNRDGRPDLSVANACNMNDCNHGSVGVLLGNGDGTFQPVLTYDSGGMLAESVIQADVDAGGKVDLAVANGCASSDCNHGSVGVLLGNGDGTFQPALTYDSGGSVPRDVHF
jgi:FG-GAP-like repeat